MKPYYDRDGITIYHGNSLDVLPRLGSVDAVLTDPPWELSDSQVEIRGNGVAPRRQKSRTIKRGCIGTFDPALVGAVVAACEGDCFILAGYKELADVCRLCDPLRGVFVWQKPNAANPFVYPARLDCSFIVWTARKSALYGRQVWPSMVFSVPFPSAGCMASERFVDPTGKALHPCQGPVDLYRQLLRPLPAGVRVVDPFMGTGTTLRAAKDLGMRAVGIDREERWCALAASRLQQGVLAFGD